ncbi:unnamed protein product, partial [Amoebophrya sp. A25]
YFFSTTAGSFGSSIAGSQNRTINFNEGQREFPVLVSEQMMYYPMMVIDGDGRHTTDRTPPVSRRMASSCTSPDHYVAHDGEGQESESAIDAEEEEQRVEYNRSAYSRKTSSCARTRAGSSQHQRPLSVRLPRRDEIADYLGDADFVETLLHSSKEVRQREPPTKAEEEEDDDSSLGIFEDDDDDDEGEDHNLSVSPKKMNKSNNSYSAASSGRPMSAKNLQRPFSAKSSKGVFSSVDEFSRGGGEDEIFEVEVSSGWKVLSRSGGDESNRI